MRKIMYGWPGTALKYGFCLVLCVRAIATI